MNQSMLKQGDSSVNNTPFYIVKNTIALGIATLSYWFNDLPPMFQLLLGVMAIDLVLGVMRVGKYKPFDIQKSWKSTRKKIVVFLLIGMAHLLERYLPIPLSSACSLFYVWHYGVSALDHAVKMGLPVPEQLRAALEMLQRDASTPKPSKENPS